MTYCNHTGQDCQTPHTCSKVCRLTNQQHELQPLIEDLKINLLCLVKLSLVAIAVAFLLGVTSNFI